MAALELDRIFFIPAALPPHKRDRVLSAPELRAELLEAALAADDRFRMDTLELERSGPSYTVDTLRAYRARFPEAELFLLLGADQYAELDTWHEPAAIRALATLAVLDRSGSSFPEEPGVVRVAVTRIDVASTAVRARVREGRSIRYLVPDAVAARIRAHRLYVGMEVRGGTGEPSGTLGAGPIHPGTDRPARG